MSSVPEKHEFSGANTNTSSGNYGQGSYGYQSPPQGNQAQMQNQQHPAQDSGYNPGYNPNYPPPQVYQQQPQAQPEPQQNESRNMASNCGNQFCGAVVFGAGATLGANIMNSIFNC